MSTTAFTGKRQILLVPQDEVGFEPRVNPALIRELAVVIEHGVKWLVRVFDVMREHRQKVARVVRGTAQCPCRCRERT